MTSGVYALEWQPTPNNLENSHLFARCFTMIYIGDHSRSAYAIHMSTKVHSNQAQGPLCTDNLGKAQRFIPNCAICPYEVCHKGHLTYYVTILNIQMQTAPHSVCLVWYLWNGVGMLFASWPFFNRHPKCNIWAGALKFNSRLHRTQRVLPHTLLHTLF